MIHTRDQGLVVKDDIQAQSTAALRIDARAMVHVMKVLTDLYKDPEMAVLREYSTNALDAHIEAGVKRPIEVTLPSALSQFLYVRDYGVGLSLNDIHEVFSQYGASTKRETNEQTGMLGLGCKSGLTYSAQFTLTSIKDGVKVSVIVSRDDEVGGSMRVVDTQTTDEPNGTNIAIPAKRDSDFVSRAQRLFRYWPEGTVLVNGEEPARIEGKPVTENILAHIGMGYGQPSYFVMGNVPYPVHIDFPGHTTITHFVEMGAIDFTPSREELHMTDRTKAYVESVKREYLARVAAEAQAEVNRAGSPWDAMRIALSWNRALGDDWHRVLSYRGEKFPEKWEAPLDGKRHWELNSTFPIQTSISSSRGTSHRQNRIFANQFHETVFISNFTPATFAKAHGQKVKKWLESQGREPHGASIAAFPGPAPRLKWVPPTNYVDFATIRAIKLPRPTPDGSTRPKGAYDIVDHEGKQRRGIPADQLPIRNLFYIRGSIHSAPAFHGRLKGHYSSPVIVSLPENRVNKFIRDFPKARNAVDAAQTAHEEWLTGLTGDERIAMNLARFRSPDGLPLRRALTMLDPRRLDDPELRRAVNIAMMDTDELVRQQNTFGATLPPVTWRSPLARYPLFDTTVARQHPDHMYRYLNTAYMAERSKG